MIKYYSINGFDKVYDNYNQANAEAVAKKIKNNYPVAFTSKEDAEAFRLGRWDEYLRENYNKYSTDADAVIYVDGSVNTSKDNPTGGYATIIMLKSGEIICESANFKDVENGTILSRRFDFDDNLIAEEPIEYPVIDGAKKGYVKSCGSDAGELEGARRALSICFYEKNVKKAIVVHDSDVVDIRYQNGTEFKSTEPQHPTYFYGQLCEKIKNEFGDDAVSFIHVDSHRGTAKSNKPAYGISEMEFVHAVFNDAVDGMAKSEVGIGEVSRTENVNLAHAIPETFFKIDTRAVGAYKKNKAAVRALVKELLAKEWLRPEFK